VELDSLLDDPQLHGVVVATPDRLHAAQCVAAAGAGKHVLVEKPMATSPEDAAAMIRGCGEAGVTLAVAYHLRWHAGHRLLATRAAEGSLGTLRHVRALWSWPARDAGNWRAHPDVGRWWSLGGVGTHCLDLIRWFMAPAHGEVETITSVVDRSVFGGAHDETAVVAMQFASGATAEFCSSVLFESPSRLEVYGSDDYAVCTGTLGPHGAGTIDTREGPIVFTPVNPYVGEIEDFAGAVVQSRAPEVDGEEGLRNVELLAGVGP
jgi:1,5-anhydro-D-fructose reductase (1,5-anhydro-D-mannitol-forming)